ncbi:tail spike protein [Salmonella phage CRW-SP2]|nr:tail spike protein [Salmonella phage CRW-SP2]
MTRNIESIFGAVVTAPHQVPYTYTATGGEQSISLPFYPLTGFITINGGVQVPVDNYEIDGNTINLGRALEAGDVVYCLFDKIISSENYENGIKIYKFQAIGNETSFTPDFTSYGVQSLYIDGKFKIPGVDYSYSSTTGVVTFLAGSPSAGVWVVAEMLVKQNYPALSSDAGASMVGTTSGNTVQEQLDASAYTSFQTGGTVHTNDQLVLDKSVTPNQLYRWGGTLPKQFPSNSSPASTGGISPTNWVFVGDSSLRSDVEKYYSHSVKLSDFTTFQELATAAVENIIVDVDYHFTDNETIDFGGKVLTIKFEKSFVADGSIIFTNLGAGSKIVDISLKSSSTPYVIYRFDENGNWLDSASVLAGLSQRRDKGYQPTVNDLDIWSSLTPEIQNQNIFCELILYTNCSGVEVIRPKGEFALIRSIMNNNVTIRDPNFLGGKGGFGSIVFANYDGTGYGYNNRVLGGRVNYGSFSSVAFLRNKGYDGGVWGFVSYRCGESGVKTWQNEVGPRSARCYELTFERITTKQCYYDGIDCNADYGTVTDRVDDYPVSQYPSRQLPTKHRIRDIFTEDAKGVGAWWDGQGVYAENITTKDSHKAGIWDVGTNNILVNLKAIGCNSDGGSYNHITCEGGSQIIGASVTIYSGIPGYAIYAPSSQASNVYCNKGLGAGVIILSAINNSRLGNTEISSESGTASLDMRPNAYLVTNSGVKMTAQMQDTTPGGESCSMSISPIQGGLYNKPLVLNRGGIGHAEIPAGSTVLADSLLVNNGTVAFYFDTTGALFILAKNQSGVYQRYAI